MSNTCSVWLSTHVGQRGREPQDTKISRDEHGVLSHLTLQTPGTKHCKEDLAQRMDLSTAELREGPEGGQSPSRDWRSSRGFGSSKGSVDEQHVSPTPLLATTQHTQALLVHAFVCVFTCLVRAQLSDPPRVQPSHPVIHKIMRFAFKGDFNDH